MPPSPNQMSHSPDGSEDERVVFREQNEIYVDDGYESGNEDTPALEDSTMPPRNFVERLINFRLNKKNLHVFSRKSCILPIVMSTIMVTIFYAIIALPFILVHYLLYYFQIDPFEILFEISFYFIILCMSITAILLYILLYLFGLVPTEVDEERMRILFEIMNSSSSMI